MHLRSFALLLSCATILPLRGEDEQAISPALLDALRASGLLTAAESVTIPLQSAFTGFIVEIRDGKPLQLVLDTGASGTILSPEAAGKLGLEAKEWKARLTSATGGQAAIRRQ